MLIDVERFFASDGVTPNDRMNVLHRFTSHNPSTLPRPGMLSLLDTGMNSLESLEKCDKLRRELLQERHLRSVERIATGCRGRDEEESCKTRRLPLVRNV